MLLKTRFENYMTLLKVIERMRTNALEQNVLGVKKLFKVKLSFTTCFFLNPEVAKY